MVTKNIGQELRNAIGGSKVRDDDISRATYVFDSVPGNFQKPDFVVLAEDREDVRKTGAISRPTDP